jgi:hypothetical protein
MLVTGIVSAAPPVEALQVFRVEANGYPAEFGSMGGFISMTTKSGTNAFHGSLYEFLRNDALNARNFFSASKAPLHYNVFGVTVGGPIRRTKLTSSSLTRVRGGATASRVFNRALRSLPRVALSPLGAARLRATKSELRLLGRADKELFTPRTRILRLITIQSARLPSEPSSPGMFQCELTTTRSALGN